MSSPNAGITYDETPYPSAAFPQTHPRKLCAMGRLFGMNAADPDRARVLELGCADGANLLPMAQQAPGGKFLGLDASAKQIAEGQAAIAAASLTNVELRVQNILDFSPAEGKFDYIIAHGIFSWVPEEVRQKILSICRENLADHGIAYVSYNAFPGWGMRVALRDMMLFHTGNLTDSSARVPQARALTAFLAETVSGEKNPYGLLLKQELDYLNSQPDAYVRHDILEETNQPFYFFQFMQRAAQAGLQYLGETSLDQMLATNFGPKVADTLQRLGRNIVAQEQYMDFVRNRNFRQTLLCHQGLQLARNVGSRTLKQFWFTSVIAPPNPLDLRPDIPATFKLLSNPAVSATTSSPLAKAALSILAGHELKPIAFGDLFDAARQKAAPFASVAGTEEEADRFAVNLLQLYGRGIVDIQAGNVEITTARPKRPAATPLARYQAMNSRKVTNRAHHSISFDILGRVILAACDGQHDFGGIMDAIVDAVRANKMVIAENEVPLQDEPRLRQAFEPRVGLTLDQMTAAGFFAP